jgi:hypothetical protein
MTPNSKRQSNPGERIAELLAQLEATADPETLIRVRVLVALLLDAHAEGLARIVALFAERDPDLPDPLVDLLADPLVDLLADPLVEDLLLLHGLHPVPRDDRGQRAIEAARAELGAFGADVELVAIGEDLTTVRLGDAARTHLAVVEQVVRRHLERAVPDAGPVQVVDQPRLLPLLLGGGA